MRKGDLIHQIETLRQFIAQNHITGGQAYSGHLVHFWKHKSFTYCGKQNFTRKDDRLWVWKINSICKPCLKAIEVEFVESLKKDAKP